MILATASKLQEIPEDMNSLMWWIISTLCLVVTFGGGALGQFVRKGFSSIQMDLEECKKDRAKLFQENEVDRKEFYAEVKSLHEEKMKIAHQMVYMAGQCNIDLGKAET